MPPSLPAPARWPALLFLFCASLLLPGCALLPGNAAPAEPGPPASAAQEGLAAFTLQVRAPEPLRTLLLTHLELQRFRHLSDLQPGELTRLLGAADANARKLLAAQGYFGPAITLHSSAAGADGAHSVVITVEPGPQTTVAGTQLSFTGAGSSAPAFERRRERLVRGWPLVPGDAFTQADWDDAKSALLRQLHARDYPTARLAHSLADVDPGAHLAHLHARYDTGPAYRFGPLVVRGAERYDSDGARRLARLPSGSGYSEAELLEAQQRLAASGYYDAAFLTLDTEHATPDGDGASVSAPVIAQVREARLQKLLFGVGASTDSGARLTLDHLHNRLPWLGWRASSRLSLDRDARLLQSEWVSLPDEQGWRRFGSGRMQREATGDYWVNSLRLRGGISQTGGHIDRNYYLQYDNARPQGAGAPPASGALSANYGWTGRYFNNDTNPTRGYGLGLELGAGTTLGQQRSPFARVLARWQAFVPLGKVALEGGGARAQRQTRLALRAEGGAVLARARAEMPVTQLFLTGGDTTVRGYAYRSLGARIEDGALYGGRYMALASAEWQRPIAVQGDLTHWESALFIDAGAVTDAPQHARLQVGVGAGLRWRSPVGPLQADLAWGVQTRRLRLHLRLGFSF